MVETLKAIERHKPNPGLRTTPSDIAKAEKSLGFVMPSSCRGFHVLVSGTEFSNWEFYRLYTIEDSVDAVHPKPRRHMVDQNRRSHDDFGEVLPSFLIIFHADGLGNLTCFDTRHRSADEYRVVSWEHEIALDPEFRVQEDLHDALSHRADSFHEWLQDEIQMLRELREDA